MESDPCKYKF